MDLHLCAAGFYFLFSSRDANADKSFKCVFQVSLAQRLCSGADQGSVNQLSLYTSPSLPNITLGLPATATATAASNVRRNPPRSLDSHQFVCGNSSSIDHLFCLFFRSHQLSRTAVCSQPSPSALPSSPVATCPTLQKPERQQAGTVRTVPFSNTWC